MKKLLLLWVFLPTLLSSAQDFNQEGQVTFKVRSNHYYEFQIPLRANTQYFFKLKGESIFNFRIIEPSGNEWEIKRSSFMDTNNHELIVWENIYEKGYYTIRIYSITSNKIKMIWGEY